MSARQRILDRLRAAPAAPAAFPALAQTSDGRLLRGPALDAALPKFVAALTSAHAEVFDARNSGWAAAVQDFCKTRSLGRLWIPGGQFPGLSSPGCTVERFARPLEQCKDTLFNKVDAGLTAADCGIADTGMLVLRSCPQQPRTLSLVPPIHLCLINVDRLYASLGAALVGENWPAALPSNLIFISGPSKTADIQQTLAYGAHGPKELIVFLTNEDVPS